MLPLGLRSPAYIWQRITNSLFIFFNKYGFYGTNYIEDLASTKIPDLAAEPFNRPHQSLVTLALQNQRKEGIGPCTRMVFLSIIINSVDLTVKLDKDRLVKINLECPKNSLYIERIQRLFGLFNFCVTGFPLLAHNLKVKTSFLHRYSVFSVLHFDLRCAILRTFFGKMT